MTKQFRDKEILRLNCGLWLWDFMGGCTSVYCFLKSSVTGITVSLATSSVWVSENTNIRKTLVFFCCFFQGLSLSFSLYYLFLFPQWIVVKSIQILVTPGKLQKPSEENNSKDKSSIQHFGPFFLTARSLFPF